VSEHPVAEGGSRWPSCRHNLLVVLVTPESHTGKMGDSDGALAGD
jgi:hypothetical protein